MKLETNEAAFEAAKGLFPGGVNSPVRAFARVGGAPRFFASAKGAYFKDLEGTSYIDLNGAWGSLILGHAPKAVVGAATRQAKRGSSFGAPHLAEIELGSIIRESMPSLERLRFVSTGTEAVMSALRLARAYAGRDLVLKFDGCYHGHHDSLLIAAGSGLLEGVKPDSDGVPKGVASLTLSVPYNDLEAVKKAFESQGSQIAAIVVEPVAANMGLVLPKPEFLAGLRTICDQYKAVLIFDEVITGFRLGLGGAQGHYKVRPDLTTLGKIVGGGYVAAAFGGKREIMDLLAPLGPVYQAGTLSGNPVAMVAGFETIKTLTKTNPYEALAERGREIAGLLEAQCRDKGLVVPQIGSMFSAFGARSAPTNFAEVLATDTSLYVKLFHQALSNGLYLSPSPFETSFISVAHDSALMKKISTLIKEIQL